jgi:sugar/nucleoside kinase (ribokinase family)
MSPKRGRNGEMAPGTSCALNTHLLGRVLGEKSATFGMMKKLGNSQRGVSVLTFLTKESVREVSIVILSIVYRKKETAAQAGDLSLGLLTLTGVFK